ncbi:AAA family ATPase [Pseudanabaena sp. UWO310]|uniref:AAA family ATPase n=1 Tax=Pseudanabaena sp. UWO310 TaxID=2480795 RepID=UPI001156DDE4|nr:ATP-binding protein [Pseudanabaena sp. UWO310]TYQ25625.1 AAA family ATPase [Pseudanabaena sp. UWO310]
MFTEVQIENYKSIQSLKINLGRVNVFIGENGCGKTNILEAIALAGAAAGNKLDNEFLFSRGIRVTEPEFMRSAFDKENITKEIKISLRITNNPLLTFVIQHKNQPYSKWISNTLAYDGRIRDNPFFDNKFFQNLKNQLQGGNLDDESIFKLQIYLNQSPNPLNNDGIDDKFMIYMPENSSLRTFEEEGQIQPLGIKGQGLLKLLGALNSSPDKINEIKKKLELIDWFDDLKIHQDFDIERTIQIRDRYLDKELPYFNQRSSNEGFLFLIFYFALFISDDTPKFFAIDNIENALNPKLCTRLIQELVELAKKYDKQVILTTHNPAILDGLDLNDDEQRLFAIYRNMDGHTQAKRVAPLEPLDDGEIVPLSEAFINGYIGGLPKNF